MCMSPVRGFPCGKCIECLTRLRHDWSIRLQNELAYSDVEHKSSIFATLTYNDEHVYRVSDGSLSLRKKDIQDFMKRLRRYYEYHHNCKGISFFICGEYGPKTLRPHYHILLFNLPSNVDNIAVLYKTWQLGHVRRPHKLIPEQCHYATKYMIMEEFLPSSNDVVKPFRLMSKGLGRCLVDDVDSVTKRFYRGNPIENIVSIASEVSVTDLKCLVHWLGKHQIYDYNVIKKEFPLDWICYFFVIDNVNDFIIHNGRKFQIPRYIREKVFPVEVRQILNVDAFIRSIKRQREYYEKFGSYDFEAFISHLPTMQEQLNNQKVKSMKRYFNKRYKDSNKNDLIL